MTNVSITSPDIEFEAVDDSDEIGSIADREPLPTPIAFVEMQVPEAVLDLLTQVAQNKGIGLDVLVRSYINDGLNTDIEALRYRRVMDKAREILTQRLESPEEVDAILEELRRAALPAGPWRRVAR